MKVAQVFWIFFAVAITAPAIAQVGTQWVPGATADATNPSGAPYPFKPDSVWHVDPITGALNISIPFPTTPQGGRGPKIPYSLHYNSSATAQPTYKETEETIYPDGTVFYYPIYQWYAVNQFPYSQTFVQSWAPPGPWTTSGPYPYSSVSNIPSQYGGPDQVPLKEGCNIYGPLNYVDESGAVHDLGTWSTQMSNTAITPQPQCVYGNITTATTGDGSFILTSPQGVFLPDGTQMIFTSSDTTSAKLEDSNGNISSIASDSLGRTPFLSTVPVTGPVVSGSDYFLPIPPGIYSLTTYDVNNKPETYNVTFSTVTFGPYSLPHPDATDILAPPPGGGSSTNFIYGVSANSTINGITSVQLPDKTSYTLQYDPIYGNVSKITYPTGGYVRFVYGVREDGIGNSLFADISSVGVTDVYESDGVNPEMHWSYTLSTYVLGSFSLSTKVTAPDETVTTYRGIPIYTEAGPFGQSSPSWLEDQRLIYSSDASLVKSVSTDNDGMLPKTIWTTYYDGPTPLQQQVNNTYDTYGNVIEKDESDYYTCSGSPCAPASTPPTGWLRKTFTTYNYTGNAAWVTAHIVNKPSKVVVTDGSGNPYSLTSYSYDESKHILSTPAGLATHDDVNYGPGSTLPRGNVTTKAACLSIAGTGSSATCSASLNTSYYYDLTGQITQKIEASGTPVAETINYTWGGQMDGFLQSVQYANGASDSLTYYTPTGQTKTHSDWNKKVTTYSYVDPVSGTPDPLNRIRTITLPSTVDGTTGAAGQGTTTYTYTDTPGAVAVQMQQTLSTSGTATSVTTDYDGLGRVIHQAKADPGGTDTVDTAYDSNGRLYSVSSPHRSSSSPTDGTTYYAAYDAVNRPLTIKNPDLTTKTFSYSGNIVTSIDENLHQWSNTSDGLGRLTQVTEPGSLVTGYAYDPLGNLLQVAQSGNAANGDVSRVRAFSYDSLSRLIAANNPENASTTNLPSLVCSGTARGTKWTTCYGYDANGNLTSKIDNRSITVAYSYDALNRLLGKSYSDGATPLSCYQYDSSSIANGVGRLTNAWTQSASSATCSTSGPTAGAYLTLKSILAYDAMGRPTSAQQQQCIGSTCSAPTPYSLSMAYDLAGNQAILTNSVGASGQPLTLNNYFDVASRPCLTTSSWSGSYPANLFQTNPGTSSPGYAPFGDLQNWYMGSNSSTASTGCSSTSSSAINVTQSYSPRLWLQSIKATGQIP